MTADPDKRHEDAEHQSGATDEGVSTTDPAEGGDDGSAPGSGSPQGVTTGETADER